MSVRSRIRFALGVALCAALSAPAFAQSYPSGGGMGGGVSGGGVYRAPKGGYSSATGAGIGGAVAAGAVVAYLALHKASVDGCVEQATDGLKIMNEKDQKTYALDSNGQDLKAGDRVHLAGKKTKDATGNQTFLVNSVKDLGPCSQQTQQAKVTQ